MLELFSDAKMEEHDVMLMSVDYTMAINRVMTSENEHSQSMLSTANSKVALSVDLIEKDKPKPST